jgi:hypothetical protein
MNLNGSCYNGWSTGHKARTYTDNKDTEWRSDTCGSRALFEHKTPVSVEAQTFHSLDSTAAITAFEQFNIWHAKQIMETNVIWVELNKELMFKRWLLFSVSVSANNAKTCIIQIIIIYIIASSVALKNSILTLTVSQIFMH